ncbi:hypothetical protein BH09CHL1_BH09CHL1_34950 [soil metagenome]
MQQRNVPKPQPRARVVDIIAEGLSVIIARPWLLLVPILLDFVIWIGIKIEPSALMSSLIRLVNDADVEDSSDVISSLNDLASSNMSQLGTLFVPSMLSGVPRRDIYELTDQSIWSPGSSGIVLLVALGLILFGALVSMIYSVPIADAILGRKRNAGELVQAIWRAWYRMVLLLGLIVGGIIAVAVPIGIVAAIFALGGVDLLPLFSSLLLLGGIGALFYGYFVFDAIVIADVGPITAIRYRVGVVHRNIRSAIGFILASLLLTTGIPEITEAMLGEAPGLVIAVGIQAIIATGAAAASFLFFVDRMRQWRPELIQVPQTAPAFDLTRQGESRS